MNKIQADIASEIQIANTATVMIYMLQRIKDHANYTIEEREQAVADVYRSLPDLRRLLWKCKNRISPIGGV